VAIIRILAIVEILAIVVLVMIAFEIVKLLLAIAIPTYRTEIRGWIQVVMIAMLRVLLLVVICIMKRMVFNRPVNVFDNTQEIFGGMHD